MSFKKSRVPFLLIALGALVFIIAQMVFASVNATIEELGSQATATIDMAGYQRTLTQRMLAMALQIQRDDRAHRAVIGPHAELTHAKEGFDTTLHAFMRGGTTKNSSGVPVSVAALTTPSEAAILHNIERAWIPLRLRIDGLGDVTPRRGAVDRLADGAIESASALSGLMNDLSEEIGRTSNRNIAELSQWRDFLVLLTVFGLMGVVLGFFLHLLESRRQIKRFAEDLQQRNTELAASAAALAAAKDRQDRIMETVRQGLFLIDADSVIQDEYSRELERIFRATDLAGMKLLDILRRMLPEKHFNTARDYLELLFDANKRERTIVDVNPLDEIEVNFPDPKGGFAARFLSFSFRRIVEDQRITRAFVAVSDVTDRVTIERGQREAEQRQQRQLELLMSVLHVEPALQAEFLETASEQLREMNDALRAIVVAGRNGHQDEVLRRRLEAVFRCVHTIKGSASLLRIEYFRKAAEQFEEKIVELRKRGNLTGEDFLVIAVAQAELRSDLDELQELRKRLGGLRPGVPSHEEPTVRRGTFAPEEPVDDGGQALLADLASLTVDLGHKLRKEVRLDASKLRIRDIGVEQRRLLSNVLVQIVRNSVAHGIELPEVRVGIGKPALGMVVLSSLPADPGFLAFSCRDDGRGIDIEAVRRDAVAQGLIAPDEAERMDDSAVAGLLFFPGFSTTRVVDEVAGRGMGMDIVKQTIVDRLGGEIGLASQPGEFFELTFTIPVRTQSSVSS